MTATKIFAAALDRKPQSTMYVSHQEFLISPHSHQAMGFQIHTNLTGQCQNGQ